METFGAGWRVADYLIVRQQDGGFTVAHVSQGSRAYRCRSLDEARQAAIRMDAEDEAQVQQLYAEGEAAVERTSAEVLIESRRRLIHRLADRLQDAGVLHDEAERQAFAAEAVRATSAVIKTRREHLERDRW